MGNVDNHDFSAFLRVRVISFIWNTFLPTEITKWGVTWNFMTKWATRGQNTDAGLWLYKILVRKYFCPVAKYLLCPYVCCREIFWPVPHYYDVIMTAMASQLTSLSNVCTIVCSGSDQSKHQSSASLVFVRWPVNSPSKDQLRGKCFHLMTSSWLIII